MLVLTRKEGQSILIGKDIIVKLLKIKGKQAHIAIQAPPNVAVDREEVAERKHQHEVL